MWTWQDFYYGDMPTQDEVADDWEAGCLLGYDFKPISYEEFCQILRSML